MAASAGGVEALTSFVGGLPANFPGAVLIALHVPDAGPSVLPGILARSGALPAIHAEDGTSLRSGLILVAPPGQHMLVSDAHARLQRGPRENGHRPSADILFRSAAKAFGHRCAGIVLSGTMDDGAAGLRTIHIAGGFTLAQDPAEAAFPGMPRAAIHESKPDVVCAVKEMPGRLLAWMDDLTTMDEPFIKDRGLVALPGDVTELSEFTCPDCGGTLWLDHTYGTDRFRCRVGHTYSHQGLLLGKQEALEAALWAAVVALEERADLSRRLLKRFEDLGRFGQVERYRQAIRDNDERVGLLRQLIGDLMQHGPLSHDGDDDDLQPAD